MSLPVEERYPICDTDLWIKVCKKDTDIIFGQYEKVYMADAVHKELKDKSEDCNDEFGCGIENYNKERKGKRVYPINIASGRIFSNDEKNQVIKHFLHYNIPYDLKNNTFKRAKNMGEKVSVIYAAVLDLEIVLSDDKGTNSFVNKHFKYVSVIRLKELLEQYGLSKREISEYIEEVNESYEQASAIDDETPITSFRQLAAMFKNN